MIIQRHGGPEELQPAERPIPEPDANQLLVAVHATSVNPVDVRVRQGGGAPRKFPLVLGFDVSRVLTSCCRHPRAPNGGSPPALGATSLAGVTLLLALSAGCRRSANPPPSAGAPNTSMAASAGPEASGDRVTVPALPARIADFVGGPLVVVDASASRRTYTRGPARIEVTLARLPMTAAAYASWVEASTAGFPQAVLGLPADEANGFYQCTTGDRPSCDLLVQLRAGFHLEVRGAGTSTRDDVDAIARGLDLRALTIGT